MKIKPSHYEKDMLESYENDEWNVIPGMKKVKKNYPEFIRTPARKDKKVHIRILRKDLESIQKKAIEEGIPYQTLISTLLHKFANGRLVEKSNLRIK
jgi:predicted DNA binding CopG/RHH family protein